MTTIMMSDSKDLLVFRHGSKDLRAQRSTTHGGVSQAVRILAPILISLTLLTTSQVGAMSVTEEVFKKLNASKHAVKVPESLGGGRLALFEFIHQIHCVVCVFVS